MTIGTVETVTMPKRGRGRPSKAEMEQRRAAEAAAQAAERERLRLEILAELGEKEDSEVAVTNPVAAAAVAETVSATGSFLDVFAAGLEAKIAAAVSAESFAAATRFMDHAEAIKSDILDAVKATVEDRGSLKIERPNGEKIKIEGLSHATLPSLLKICAARLPSMLVGSAGSGKTTAAEQVAIALGLPFYAVSVGAQTSKSDLIGYMSASGQYVSTMFRQAYEHGGVFVCDEIDAGNANVLIILNSALAGQWCAFPDGMVKRHPDFVFVGTANTFGTGANRQYVGRNQLDSATLDRFVSLDWDIDTKLEAAMVKGFSQGARWHAAVKAARALVESRGYRVVVSPRATMKGAVLLEQGFSVGEVINMTLLPTAAADQKEAIRLEATAAWKAAH